MWIHAAVFDLSSQGKKKNYIFLFQKVKTIVLMPNMYMIVRHKAVNFSKVDIYELKKALKLIQFCCFNFVIL